MKLKMHIKYKRIDVYDLEKNELIKKILLNDKTKIKIENNNEFSIDGEKYKTSSKEVNNWVNQIKKVIET